MRQEVLSPQTQVPSAPLFGKVLSLSFLSLQLPRWENGGPEGMGGGQGHRAAAVETGWVET